MENKIRVVLIIFAFLIPIGLVIAFSFSGTVDHSGRELSADELKKEKAIKELAAALSKTIAPSSATESDWRAAKVTRNILNDIGIPFWTLVKMRPILEADTRAFFESIATK